MLAFVAPLLAFLTVPDAEGDEFAAMRAAAEAGLPSTAAGPERESRTASNTCSDTPGWTNPYGYGCGAYKRYWCAGGGSRRGQAWALGKAFDHPEAHCCACGKVKLDDIYQQRALSAIDAAHAGGFVEGVASVTPEDGVTQADVDAARAAGAASVTPEDGVTQADVDAAKEAVCTAASGTWADDKCTSGVAAAVATAKQDECEAGLGTWEGGACTRVWDVMLAYAKVATPYGGDRGTCAEVFSNKYKGTQSRLRIAVNLWVLDDTSGGEGCAKRYWQCTRRI